jgi:hypothetical protein
MRLSDYEQKIDMVINTGLRENKLIYQIVRIGGIQL